MFCRIEVHGPRATISSGTNLQRLSPFEPISWFEPHDITQIHHRESHRGGQRAFDLETRIALVGQVNDWLADKTEV